MHTCMHMSTAHVCTCLCTHLCTCLHAHLYPCRRSCLLHVAARVGLLCISTGSSGAVIHRHRHRSAHTSMHMSIHMSTHMSVRTSIHMSMHTSIHTSIHVYTQVDAHVYAHVYAVWQAAVESAVALLLLCVGRACIQNVRRNTNKQQERRKAPCAFIIDAETMP